MYACDPALACDSFRMNYDALKMPVRHQDLSKQAAASVDQDVVVPALCRVVALRDSLRACHAEVLRCGRAWRSSPEQTRPAARQPSPPRSAARGSSSRRSSAATATTAARTCATSATSGDRTTRRTTRTRSIRSPAARPRRAAGTSSPISGNVRPGAGRIAVVCARLLSLTPRGLLIIVLPATADMLTNTAPPSAAALARQKSFPYPCSDSPIVNRSQQLFACKIPPRSGTL